MSKDEISRLCRAHLNHTIKHSRVLEDRVFAAHLLYKAEDEKDRAPCGRRAKCERQRDEKAHEQANREAQRKESVAELQTAAEYQRKNRLTEAPEECSDLVVEDETDQDSEEYLIRMKGRGAQSAEGEKEIDKVVEIISKRSSTQCLRMGYSVLSNLLGEDSSSANRHRVSQTQLEKRVHRIVKMLSDTMGGVRQAVKQEMKEVARKMFARLGERFTESPEWSEQSRTETLLFLDYPKFSVTEEDVLLINSKNKGCGVGKLLLKVPHTEYAKYLPKLELGSVGTRNIAILSQKTTDATRTALFNFLVREKSPNALFFLGGSALPEYLHALCPTHHNEEIRTKYLESIATQKDVLSLLELVASWITCNQIVLGKENQKGLRDAFSAIMNKAGHYLRTYERQQKHFDSATEEERRRVIQKVESLESENARTTESLRKISHEVVNMCRGHNYDRKLQGWHYLHTLYSHAHLAEFIRDSVASGLFSQIASTTYREIREIAERFGMPAGIEDLKRAFREENDSRIYTLACLMSRKERTAEEFCEIASFLLSQITENRAADENACKCECGSENTCRCSGKERQARGTRITQEHAAVHVLRVLYSAREGGVIAEGNRINPEIVCRRRKDKKSENAAGRKAPEKRHGEREALPEPYRIEAIYLRVILPLFKKALSFLQQREIYLSNFSEEGPAGHENTKIFSDIKQEEYISNWYVLRECCVFLSVYGIAKEEKEVVPHLFESLLTVGGHPGNIIVVSQCIKNVLTFFDDAEYTKAQALETLRAVEEGRFKTVKRCGGVPYAFKALCGTENSTREKTVTEFVLKTVIRKSFQQIESLIAYLQSTKHLELTLLEAMPLLESGLLSANLLGKEFSTSGETADIANIPIANTELLIHYINILKEIARDGVFRYELLKYEASMFLLSCLLITHSNWKVRNASLMLYTALIKKMCKEALNAPPAPIKAVGYAKIHVEKRSREVILEFLRAFDKRQCESGVFSCLVFFSRVPQLLASEAEEIARMEREAKYCKRVQKKIEQTVQKRPEEVEDAADMSAQMHNEHELVPEEVISFIEENRESLRGAAGTGRACGMETKHAESVCGEKIAYFLSILGSEEKQIRKYVISQIEPEKSYEHILRRVITEHPCVDSHIEEELKSTEEERRKDTALFSTEVSNIFRDLAYEKDICGSRRGRLD